MSRSDVSPARPRARRSPAWRMAVPLVLFAVLAGLFFLALHGGDPSRLPSALIGKPVPEFELPPVEGLAGEAGAVPGFAARDLARGEVSVVNVWASWCIPCHQEHPHLVALGERSGAPMFGLNYKDDAAAARRFLGRYGNPFVAVGADASGRTAINWGVYGVPETFVVDGAGRIAYKHVGPIDEAAVAERLLPAIARARGR